MLRPFLFNISITDIVYQMNGADICDYTDDTTLYSCDREVKTVVTKLEQNANHLATWLPEKHIKLNEGKCQLIILRLARKRLINSLLVLQNFTTAQKSGKILLAYLKSCFFRYSLHSDECQTEKTFKYVRRMLPLFHAIRKVNMRVEEVQLEESDDEMLLGVPHD